MYTSVKRGLDLLSNYRSMDHAAISGHMSFTSCHFLFCFVFYHSHLVDYSVILISRRFVPVPSVIYFSSFRQAASATCLLIKSKLYMIVPPPPPPRPQNWSPINCARCNTYMKLHTLFLVCVGENVFFPPYFPPCFKSLSSSSSSSSSSTLM